MLVLIWYFRKTKCHIH